MWFIKDKVRLRNYSRLKDIKVIKFNVTVDLRLDSGTEKKSIIIIAIENIICTTGKI